MSAFGLRRKVRKGRLARACQMPAVLVTFTELASIILS